MLIRFCLMHQQIYIWEVIMSKKTQEQLNKYLQKEICKAKDLGISLYLINPVVSISKSKTCFGMCKKKISPPGKIECFISLSDFARKLSKKEIKSIIMHEVLHASVGSIGHDNVWRNNCSIVKSNYSYDGYEKYHLHKHPYSKSRAKEAYRSGAYC